MIGYSTLWSYIKPAINTEYKKNNTYILQSEDRKVGEATDTNKVFVFLEIIILIITYLLVL